METDQDYATPRSRRSLEKESVKQEIICHRRTQEKEDRDMKEGTDVDSGRERTM